MENAEHPDRGPSPRRGIGCLVTLMGVFAGLGFIGMLIAGLAGGWGGADGQLIEHVESTESGATQKLVIIDVRGLMVSGSSPWSGPGITRSTLSMLDRALEDETVAGVLLRLDTPGGAVTDADLVYQKILQVRRANKRVVVHMGDMCASGGIYAAVAADKVWAHPTTLTGSVGVIIHTFNIHKLMAKYGIEDQSVYAAADGNKPLMSPTRPMSPEHRAILQGVVDEMYVRFVEIVVERRALGEGLDARWRDGRVMTAAAAQESGLIDGIGYHDEVLRKLKALVPGELFNVVRYEPMPSFLGLLSAKSTERSLEATAFNALGGNSRPMYLYAPGLIP